MTVGHNIIQKFVNQLQPMIYPKVNRKQKNNKIIKNKDLFFKMKNFDDVCGENVCEMFQVTNYILRHMYQFKEKSAYLIMMPEGIKNLPIKHL